MCSHVVRSSVIETNLTLLMMDIHGEVYFLHALRFTRNYQHRKILLRHRLIEPRDDSATHGDAYFAVVIR
jgi:hypothetical protein